VDVRIGGGGFVSFVVSNNSSFLSLAINLISSFAVPSNDFFPNQIYCRPTIRTSN